MKWLVVVLILLIPSTADAIVIRDDVPDTNYRVAASAFPALADLPYEGQGILIAPQWVVTAAHAVAWQTDMGMKIKDVTIEGVPYAVERVIVYPGYKSMPNDLVASALKTGDARPAMEFHLSSNDVALLKLAAPVRGVTPAQLYTGDVRVGDVVEIIGKGATGTGLTGFGSGSSHRTALRRAFTRLSSVQDHWLAYTFEKPPSALPLEGMAGSGDSGGPVLVNVRGQWQVAALASFKFVDGDARAFHDGVYGTTTYNVRVSPYKAWIDSTMRSGTSQ